MNDEYTNEEKKAYYKDLIERRMGVLRQAYRDFRKIERLGEFLDIAKKADNLSFSNQLIVWKENIKFMRFEGYRKWQEKSRQVRYGSKSVKFLTGNCKDPKILYMFDKASTSGKETEDRQDIADYKEDILKYMEKFSLNKEGIAGIYGDFDIIRAYREGLGQDIETRMLYEMEEIVKTTALTNDEFYHDYNLRHQEKDGIMQAVRKISTILIASKLGEDVDSIYGKEALDEIFSILNNNTRLFTIWSYAKKLTEGFMSEMEQKLEKEAVVKNADNKKESIEEIIANEKEYAEESIADRNEPFREKSAFETENQRDYWVVEFNEGLSLIEKDYEGELVSKELLDEIKELDEKIRVHNKIAGEDEYGQMTDEWVGYSKFYFNHIVDGKVEENFRIDIGEGNEVNQRDFAYLYEQIEASRETKEHSTEDIDSTLKNVLENESMTVVSNEEDYVKLFPYFKDFVYTDGSKFEEYNPFEEDKELLDLARFTFFKNNDGEYRVVYNNTDSLIYSSNVDRFLERIKAIETEIEDDIAKTASEDKIAVKVGNYYSVVTQEKVKDISLEETGVRIYPRKNNFLGKIYPLYRASTFEESTKIDALFDEMATSMKEANLTNLNDVLYLENQGLYEISPDKVTEEKGGFDFEVASFNTQFPDYYNDIYVYNRNLKIDDAYQKIAHINRENEIHFSVNLPEEEKIKILEIRDKKEILSALIFKDVKDIGEYQFNPQSEEFILDGRNISEDRLKAPEHITDSIDEREGYEAELVLDMKNKQLKQSLKYNGYMLNSNLAIQYDSYKEMLQNLSYLLDDNHRNVMLTDYINQQIDKANKEKNEKSVETKQMSLMDILKEKDNLKEKEEISSEKERVPVNIGTKVIYQGEEYTVSDLKYNNILKKNDLWLHPATKGNYKIPIVSFSDRKELNEKIIVIDTNLNLEEDKSELLHHNLDVINDKGAVVANQFIVNVDNQNREGKYAPDDEYMGSIPPVNYKITRVDEILPPSERLKNNMEAIKVLKKIEERHSHATKEEQDILSKYVGWGGLSDVFDEEKGGQWSKAREFLKENLSPLEYEAAKESTLTAFFTPKTIIDSVYKTLSDMGFKSGNILEPSMGVGNFIGNLPDEMSKSKFYGVELDSVSGRIGKLLYPESNIQVKGFEKTTFSNNFFDVAIGNVPFGEFKVNDRDYDKNNFLIHDYFFAKSIDKVRNGGIIAFITSSGTMDKKGESVRKYIAARAEMLGAIRLPNNVFKGVAGTEVTSDIIFLKKRDSIMERDEEWIHLSEDKKGLTYNSYFVNHPEMILGTMEEVSGRFGNTITCSSDFFSVTDEMSGKSFKERLELAGKEISSKTKYEEAEVSTEEDDIIPATDDVKNFSYAITDGEIYYRENSLFMKNWMWKAVKETDEKGEEYTVHIRRKPTVKEKEKVKAYIGIREALNNVIKSQKENLPDEELRALQKKLNEVYDEFSKKYDFINSRANTRIFRQDAAFPLVSSIEILDEDRKFAGKGDIFSKRTIKMAEVINHANTSMDALVLSISQRGYVDFDYMENLTDKDRDTLIRELEGEIFLDIKDFDKTNNIMPFQNFSNDEPFHFNYVAADEYLSGNIRKKIGYLNSYINELERVMEFSTSEESDVEYLKEISKLNYQREKLQEVMPKELTASEINVKLGSVWIPSDDVRDFIFETLKTPFWAKRDINVRFSEENSVWNIEGKNRDEGNDTAEMTFGTSRVNAYRLIENSLNLKDTKVYDKKEGRDGEEISVLNKKETLLAGQKQELLNNEFKNWIFNDRHRRERLVKLYNERFNCIRNREYDGKNLSFDGMNPEIKLKEYQKNAIARILYGGNTLLAHAVGAGKTFEMVAAAMEAKRLGMCTKSLFVVPNHITGQIGSEFMKLYPGANILVADNKDFETKHRKRFLGRIATGEYDAVIIGHTQFGKIPMSKEYQEMHISDQIDEIIRSIKQYKHDREQNFTVKELEKTKKKLEARLEKLNNDFKKDDVITFEELGIDKLFIDEAHNYKNLYLYTKMKNVAGIGTSASLKSSDMFMKCRYMDEMTGGKGVVFATGTPVSNSMTELYTMQRYLQYDSLKENRHENFDSWASTFGETTSDFELSPEGKGYRIKTRFSRFFNLPELMTMFKETADIQTSDMLNLPAPEAHFETVKTMPSAEQKEILNTLSERADKVRNTNVDPKIDNMLKITNDGRLLALDQRLLNPLLPDNSDSKVNICVRKVFEIWENTKEKKSAQLIFSDISTPKKYGEFNIYDDIRNKLVAMGIPKGEIAFIHDASSDMQKEKIFSKVRSGEVRVLMGSTYKMGAGTNVQNKLIALHDLDVPWRPADLEQRAGRIVRQGNENKEVYIYRYVTENTFDAYLWVRHEVA